MMNAALERMCDLLDLMKAGKPTHIDPPKTERGRQSAMARGYYPNPPHKKWKLRMPGEQAAAEAANSPRGELVHLGSADEFDGHRITDALLAFDMNDTGQRKKLLEALDLDPKSFLKDPVALTKWRRKMLQLVHPDHNSHPRANEAVMKVEEMFRHYRIVQALGKVMAEDDRFNDSRPAQRKWNAQVRAINREQRTRVGRGLDQLKTKLQWIRENVHHVSSEDIAAQVDAVLETNEVNDGTFRAALRDEGIVQNAGMDREQNRDKMLRFFERHRRTSAPTSRPSFDPSYLDTARELWYNVLQNTASMLPDQIEQQIGGVFDRLSASDDPPQTLRTFLSRNGFLGRVKLVKDHAANRQRLINFFLNDRDVTLRRYARQRESAERRQAKWKSDRGRR